MRKLFLLSIALVLSIAAMAQTIIVEGKDGSATPYDANQVSSVDFQASPAGFTVNQEGKSDKYEFANVKGIATSPNGITYTLTCTDSPTQINADNEGSLTFVLTQSWRFLGETSTLPLSDYGIEQNSDEFTTKVSSSLPRTNKDGKAYVTFMAKDIVNLTRGTVTATCTVHGMTLTAQGTVMGLDWTYELRCINSPQYIDADGNAAVTFELWGKGTDQWGKSEMYEIPNATVNFTCTEGKCDETATTDRNGRVTVNFKTDDPENFKKSIITATCEFRGKNATQAEGIVYGLPTYTLTCTDSPQEIDASGDAYLTFNLTATLGEETRPVEGATLNFTAINGECNESKKTDAEGNAEVNFEAADLLEFTEGSLTATFEKDGKTYTATGQVTGNLEWTLELNPVPSEKQIYSDGTTNGAFTLIATVTDKEGGESQFLIPGITVNCTTTSGTCTPSAVAGEDEEFADFVFQTDDILNFEGATVTGTCEYKGKTYEGTFKVLPLDWDYILTCKNSGQTIDKEGKATLQFQLEASTTANLAGTATTIIQMSVVPKATVSFAASEGSCSPVSGVTDEAGMVEVVFLASDPKTFEEGTVTATYVKGAKTVTGEGEVKGDPEAFVDPCDTGDADLNKANLMDNSYVIKNKKTGEEQVRDYAPTWSEWRKDGKDFISFYLEDADENGMTQGDAWGHLPWNIVNVVKALTGQSFENSPGGKFGLGVYVKDCQLNANFAAFTGESGTGIATEGNLKPESKIMIRKPCNTKKEASAKMRRAPGEEEEYTGEYELLFYLVFQNQTYNRETGEMEDGDEYEVYGKGTMKMHEPVLTSMRLSSESQYLKVGESTKVNVDGYYEEEAQWDWSDVQIAGQSTNYSEAYDGVDEGFFTWDAATQTLTSVKSNNNEDVYVVFSLMSRPSCKSAMTIATGEGWKYTMIKVGPEEQEVSPGYYCSYYVEDWAPRESEDEEFDDSAIEIDPESDPDGNFHYVHYNGRYSARLYVYRSDAAPGEYNLRLRLKSNHDVGCTMKITIKGRE
ncbi:MAG: hypothetical protein IJT28_00900 [Bacteroidaceae bacterium]|nr:hypothetical protein [Bacteroidaceae bacterium]